MHLSKLLIPITATLFLSACGGGDSNDRSLCADNTSGCTNSSGDSSTGDSSTGDSGTDATQTIGAGTGNAFQEGVLDISPNSLLAGGKASIKVNIVDSNSHELFTSDATVTFTSTCAGQSPAKASIDSPITTSGGVATTTYQAQGCVGQDTITATLSGDSSSATGIVTIASPVIGGISSTSVSPDVIALKGFGSSVLPSSSKVVFTVVDENGNPVEGQKVNFSPSSTLGGISLTPPSDISDVNGEVETTVNSGSVNTTVRVLATLDGTVFSSSSDAIAMFSGLPTQGHFSDSADILNPRGLQRDGTEVKINIRAADQLGNLAPDGTNISFIAVGGAIEGSCKTSGGACSATWISQDPRPADGIAKILIRSTGQEKYTDNNSNGVYDIGEPIVTSLDEAFLDLNGNSSWDAGEFFSDFNNDKMFTPKADPSLYLGASCSDAAKNLGHCAALVDVREQINLCMSSDKTSISGIPASIDLKATSPQTISITLRDHINGLTPASGTTVAISSDNGTITSGASGTVSNTCSSAGFTHKFSIKADDSSSLGGEITITVKNADGTSTSASIAIVQD